MILFAVKIYALWAAFFSLMAHVLDRLFLSDLDDLVLLLLSLMLMLFFVLTPAALAGRATVREFNRVPEPAVAWKCTAGFTGVQLFLALVEQSFTGEPLLDEGDSTLFWIILATLVVLFVSFTIATRYVFTAAAHRTDIEGHQ